MAAAAALTAAITATLLASSCGVLNKFDFGGQLDPITPEQSKAQVLDAARDIVNTTHLDIVKAVFWRSSCNDQGDQPYRSELLISRPLKESFDAADADDATLIDQLKTHGWHPATDFHTHGTALTKNNVVAVIGPQNASTPTRGLHLYGECRDYSSEKNQNSMEDTFLTTP
ncbi:hypothetical protein MI170_02135 [Mycolicibacterium goodii]|uniref:hypothetical protein n=1 Tax=Mycolicibacterium goodii TaxID=134601 RepID=UPI001F03A044|nr:hypothetical protein [Mycolicibacterium goodii]ULN48209.1 hypothetical protein MI170_02135 [Mycolicibacterium goodii]